MAIQASCVPYHTNTVDRFLSQFTRKKYDVDTQLTDTVTDTARERERERVGDSERKGEGG